eukprot:364283-Chlamydomonas_euryale.AAC.34
MLYCCCCCCCSRGAFPASATTAGVQHLDHVVVGVLRRHHRSGGGPTGRGPARCRRAAAHDGCALLPRRHGCAHRRRPTRRVGLAEAREAKSSGTAVTRSAQRVRAAAERDAGAPRRGRCLRAGPRPRRGAAPLEALGPLLSVSTRCARIPAGADTFFYSVRLHRREGVLGSGDVCSGPRPLFSATCNAWLPHRKECNARRLTGGGRYAPARPPPGTAREAGQSSGARNRKHI